MIPVFAFARQSEAEMRQQTVMAIVETSEIVGELLNRALLENMVGAIGGDVVERPFDLEQILSAVGRALLRGLTSPSPSAPPPRQANASRQTASGDCPAPR